jgi:hypothetical protein
MDAEHDHVLWPVQVTDDVGDLGDQFRIGGELERLHPPGLEAALTPHSDHRPVPNHLVRYQKFALHCVTTYFFGHGCQGARNQPIPVRGARVGQSGPRRTAQTHGGLQTGAPS